MRQIRKLEFFSKIPWRGTSMNKVRSVVLLALLLSVAVLCRAQSFVLDLPRASQHAVLTQRIGITDVTINYHRPLANNRKVWGKLVPYGQPWRAGANENTTISFSGPVMIEGQPLAAGTYGLHMIPNENAWVVAFSKMNAAWGSFTYDQAEDALRVTVKPTTTDFHDALTYDFDDLKPSSAVVTLRWERVAVPIKVSVDVHDAVEQSLRKQLRGLAQYSWQGWDDAANYWLAEKVNLDEALKDTDQSIGLEERYDNLMTKSQVLDALGRKDEAAVAQKQALDKADVNQLYGYALQLQGQGKQEEAFAVYRRLAKKYPDHWRAHAAMARVYSGQGDFDNALKEANAALPNAPDGIKPILQGFIKKLQDKQDINKS
jgi:tetratricopeptide (TPR) repeat protein